MLKLEVHRRKIVGNFIKRVRIRLRNDLEDLTKKIYVKIIKILPNKQGTKKNGKDKVIVSLTSYPARFDTIHLCIKSLMYQTIKPDKIILWLGSDSAEVKLPLELEELKKFGLEVIYKDENLKPHKKYYYAIQDYPNSIVITVDDDVIYSPTMLASLLKMHEKYPKTVCARRVHEIVCNQQIIAKYNSWNQACQTVLRPAMRLMAVGVGGVLYPPNALDKLAFDKELIKNVCLNADDLWLKFMEALQNTKVVWCPCLWGHPANILENQSGLCDSNVGDNRNDKYLEQLSKHFPEVITKIAKEKELER